MLSGAAAGAGAVLLWLGRDPGDPGGALVAPQPAVTPPVDPGRPPLADEVFLAFLGHAFRTPLTAIIGYSEMLQEDAVFLEQNDFVPDLKQIRKAGEHLLVLVDDVVDHCRVAAGELEVAREPVDVSRLAREVEHDVRPVVARTLGTLEIAIDPTLGLVRTDPRLLRRALSNLLRHSATLTAKGALHLAVGSEGGEVVFVLRHQGLELDPAQVESLVEDVAGAEVGAVGEYHGSGLGLVITGEFARLLGGGLRIGRGEDATLLTLWIPAG